MLQLAMAHQHQTPLLIDDDRVDDFQFGLSGLGRAEASAADPADHPGDNHDQGENDNERQDELRYGSACFSQEIVQHAFTFRVSACQFTAPRIPPSTTWQSHGQDAPRASRSMTKPLLASKHRRIDRRLGRPRDGARRFDA